MTQPIEIEAREERPARLLRPKEVAARLGVSKTYVYRLARLGRFPRPVKIGPHWSAWVEAEVDAWIAKHLSAREAAR